jgi:MSHA biogenesis protein MshL
MTTPRPCLPALARTLVSTAALLLSACAELPSRTPDIHGTLRSELAAQPLPAASAPAGLPVPDAVGNSLLGSAPAPAPLATEPRFDLVVNGAQVRDVFLALVSDTRYSMVMHPEVAGTVSVTLRGVTVREALETIRDVYGYDFRIDGRRVTVFPPTLQTRVFTLNVLHTQRSGRSEVRVSSGSAPAHPGSGSEAKAQNAQPDSSQLATTTQSDFWAEITAALKLILGSAPGRSVVASPQAGVVAVRGLPDELRQVETFLRSAKVAVERQVMLEAKIVEVELSDGHQAGVDWSLLRRHASIGTLSGSTANAQVANSLGVPVQPATGASLLPGGIALPTPGTGLFGLALAGNGFQAVLGFLETHGEVQILSSPRVATLNNQKAVLKVGTDDYFVTNVSGGSITSGTATSSGTTTLPTLSLTPFFSGVALDVTPQIDEDGMITLHIHPSVTQVTEKTKQIDLGTIGNYRLPLASSSVNETDTMVRVPDGQLVAIGGLMRAEAERSSSGLPGAQANAVTGTVFGNRLRKAVKKELVVLIRPTVIRGAEDWQALTERSRAALDAQDSARTRVISLDARSTREPAAPAR